MTGPVSDAHPAMKGCDEGDIQTMLENGKPGGTGAGLNAICLGPYRPFGVPAHEDPLAARAIPGRAAWRCRHA